MRIVKWLKSWKGILFILSNSFIILSFLIFFMFVIFVSSLTQQQQYEHSSETFQSSNNNEIITLFENSPLIPPYIVTEEYGFYTGNESYMGGHYGIDMSGGYGAKVLTVLDGIVTDVVNTCSLTNCDGYGNMITIKHHDTFFTRYAHLDSVFVSVGQTVTKGQIIGLQGNTGRSTGTHLHFEVRVRDDFIHEKTRNPRNYFKL